jgi:hypothetical protein
MARNRCGPCPSTQAARPESQALSCAEGDGCPPRVRARGNRSRHADSLDVVAVGIAEVDARAAPAGAFPLDRAEFYLNANSLEVLDGVLEVAGPLEPEIALPGLTGWRARGLGVDPGPWTFSRAPRFRPRSGRFRSRRCLRRGIEAAGAMPVRHCDDDMVEAKFGRIDLRLGHRARFTRPRGGSLKWLHPVSRLGGREGESFSSPEVQRK